MPIPARRTATLTLNGQPVTSPAARFVIVLALCAIGVPLLAVIGLLVALAVLAASPVLALIAARTPPDTPC